MKIIAKIKEGNALEGFCTDFFAVCDKCDAIDHHSKDAPLDVWSKLDEVLASVIKNSVKEWR